MLDLKVLNATLLQLEEEKKIPREVILEAIEQALAAAYKKDFGKKGQIIRTKFNPETGDMEFIQVKTVVDETTVKPALTEEQIEEIKEGTLVLEEDADDERVRFNEEHHMYIDTARIMKSNAEVGEEMIFPLEAEEDFGRIAAQTAKQVIIQRIREAERGIIMKEYTDREGEILSGTVQKVSRGNVFIEIGRTIAIIPSSEKIPGEFYKTGQRIKALLYEVEETPRGINLKLSRSHPRFIEALFAVESPEVASGTVEIMSIAREAGSRSKIAVFSHDDNIDPIGACVGQRGVRVSTVIGELSGEKIDIVPFEQEIMSYISNALSPAQVINVSINEKEHMAKVDVAEDQLSLAIGKEGQNVRLAAKLTGWKIDISGIEGVFHNEQETEEELGTEDTAALASAIAAAQSGEAEVKEEIADTPEVTEEVTEA